MAFIIHANGETRKRDGTENNILYLSGPLIKPAPSPIHCRRGQGKLAHQRGFTLCSCYFTPKLLPELAESTSVFQHYLTLSVFQFPLRWQLRTRRPLYDWAMEHTLFLFMQCSTLLLAALHSVGLLSPQIHAWDARLVDFDFSSPLLSTPL